MKKIFLCIFLFSIGYTIGQTKAPVKPGTKAKTAFPKINMTIGGLKGGDISPETLSKIVDSALIAKDENATTYAIVRFRLFYKFKSTYQDEESGQKKSSDDMRTSDFTNTSVLPELWRQSIKDNIKKGDEMILDNIIVVLKNGSKIMAPSITFKII
ncbi:MAG: hypothetical protein IT249_09685 [Chitinophagaceae bacterium]|nr:hypothetical protein [Chitinophagaceae bacterium]